MFKSFFQLANKNVSVRHFAKSSRLKKIFCLDLTDFTKIYSPQLKLSRFYWQNPNYQNYKIKNSAVLLSGILSFFGLQKPEEPLTEEEKLINTIKRGILLIQKEKFDKAEELLHVALKLAQDQKDEDGIIYIYDVLANLAFETNQYEKAKKLFVNVLQKLLAKGESENSNKVIHISLKMAKIFEAEKDFKKAEEGYKFCISNLDDKLKEEDEDTDTLALWGLTMYWYGRYLLSINRKTDALEYFKKAYEMSIKINGIEHEQTAVLLNDLGTVSSMVGDNESAMSYLEEAKNIGTKLPELKELASIYINLGMLYLLKEMYQESRLACQEGLKKAKMEEDEVALFEANQCLQTLSEVLQQSKEQKERNVIIG